MTIPVKALVCATIAAASLVAAGAHALPAAAATPCWKTLLNDWYDGRIERAYPIHCYKDALRHLPTDVQTYSSAHDDILRALQSAKARLKGKHVTPNTIVPGQTSRKSTTPMSVAPSHRDGGGGGSGGGGGGSPGRKPGKGLPGVATGINTSSPSSVPLPLLVLGGLAILLVAAGAAGIVAKRIQARRNQP